MKLGNAILIKIINFINLFSVFFLITQLPIYYGKLQRLAIIAFLASYLIEFVLEKRWAQFKWNKTQWIFVLFIGYFFLTLIYAPFEVVPNYLSRILEIRLPFILTGIIGLFGVNKLYKLKYFAYAFIITSLLMISYLIFYKIGYFVFLHDQKREFLLEMVRKQSINSHMIFNYFLNVSLIFTFYLLSAKNKFKYSIIFKFLAAFSGLIIYVILLMSEGRLGFLMANLIVFVMIFHLLWKWHKILAIFIGLALFCGMGYAISHHNRINKNEVTHEPRLIVWKLASEVIKAKPIFGNGASTGANIFMDKLASCKELNVGPQDVLGEAIYSRRLLGAHAHSQFIMTVIEFGFFGLIIFLFMNLFPLFVMPPKLRIYIVMFIVISCAQLLTDIYFSGITPLTYALLMVLFFRSVEAKEL